MCTFGGAAAASVAPGATAWCDPLYVDLHAGTRAFIRTCLVVPAGGTWPRGFPPIVSLGEASLEGLNLADNTQAGGTAYSGGANGGCYAPCALIAAQAVPAPSVLMIGDSLSWGQGDDSTGLSGTPSGDGLGNYGPIQRALYAGGYGLGKMVRSGGYARDVVGPNVRDRQFSPFASTAVVLLGTNDLSGTTPSLATMQGYLGEIWTAQAAMGLRVIGATLPPHTTSTDTWATVANQTIRLSARATAGSLLGQLNNWIRSTPAPLSGYLEFADAVMTGRDSGVWQPNFTNDGTHWNQASGIPAAQAVVDAAVARGAFA